MARADLANATSQRVMAERDLDRSQKLYESHVISQSDLDRAATSHDGAVARERSASEKVRLLEIGSRNEEIVAHTDRQVRELFPSARDLKLVWSHVVKLAQSLYRESPGMEPFRPQQRTPVPNFFLAGSYTRQDYIDSMFSYNCS